MFARRHQEEQAFVPARVMNMVVIVDEDFRGEIENRLTARRPLPPVAARSCARSRPAGRKLDAWAAIGTDDAPRSGTIAVGRERVELRIGERHLAKLDTIVDPLLVPDLATMVWSPHGHEEAIDALRRLAQIVLIDSQDEPDVEAALARADDLTRDTYVVDLAWLRSTPWRERVAATFDSPRRRPDLRAICAVTVRHREDSLASGLLFCGWLASRLDWMPGALANVRGRWSGYATTRRQDIRLTLEPVEMSSPGLAGVTVELCLGRSPSRSTARPAACARSGASATGPERAWMVMGASRGEGGILGEGVRQALLRDPTYRPALRSAEVMVG